jgi:hypothetical protein
MSSTRMLPKFQVMTALAATGNLTSTPTNATGMDNLVYQINVTAGGAPTGTFKVQASVDYEQDSQGNVTNAGNWVDVPSATAAITTNGSYRIALTALPDPWCRLAYTFTSGTGTVNAFVAGKHV